MRPRSGASAPASTCTSVDLPAPLWPTSPRHSPAATSKSTPSRARTAPKCFSTPRSSTMRGATPGVTRAILGSDRCGSARRRRALLLQVRLDRRDRLRLRVLLRGDAADRDLRQRGFEVALREGEVRDQHVVRDVLAAVEHLLRDPEGERRDARSDRRGPGRVAVLGLLLLPPLQLVLAVAHDDRRARPAGGGEGLRGTVAVAALVDDADDRRQ